MPRRGRMRRRVERVGSLLQKPRGEQTNERERRGPGDSRAYGKER